VTDFLPNASLSANATIKKGSSPSKELSESVICWAGRLSNQKILSF
jgi:hypothetical protein